MSTTDRSEFERIAQLKPSYSRDPEPDGWTACIHPEGILYHRSDRSEKGLLFLTDADICKRPVFEKVKLTTEIIEKRISTARESQDLDNTLQDIDVVLEADETLGTAWEYYLVDHPTQHLFWLDKHTISTTIYQGAESRAHVGK